MKTTEQLAEELAKELFIASWKNGALYQWHQMDQINKDEWLRVATHVLQREQKLREQNETFRAAQKACDDCDAPTMAEVREMREREQKMSVELSKDKQRLDWFGGDETNRLESVVFNHCVNQTGVRAAIDLEMNKYEKQI